MDLKTFESRGFREQWSKIVAKEVFQVVYNFAVESVTKQRALETMDSHNNIEENALAFAEMKGAIKTLEFLRYLAREKTPREVAMVTPWDYAAQAKVKAERVLTPPNTQE